MEFSTNRANGTVDHVLLAEMSDLALMHGYAKLPEKPSLPLWYRREHALDSLLPAEADFALTHGKVAV